MAGEAIRNIAQKARDAFISLSSFTVHNRNEALLAIGKNIRHRQAVILEANKQDVRAAKLARLSAPLVSRLTLTEEKCNRMIEALAALSKLPDPLGQVQYARELADGLRLYRSSCAMGVIGVIFESRPDALVQISSLCLKSGNVVLLKGGYEARKTNEALYQAIMEATESVGLPQNWCSLLHSREDVAEMLKQDDCIDLIIPRGSNEFVRYIMQNSSIPVLGHADGICHVYVDSPCDIEMAVKITVDSKAQNLSVCNAAETLLVHKDIAKTFLPIVSKALVTKGIDLRGDEHVREIIPCAPAQEEDWHTEYLDAILSIKIVNGLDEAIAHINRYGSGHTDAIVSSEEAQAKRFMDLVDSAGVYHNCSTRFADGFLYGLGAEVGIATGKLHARGPMGLEGLCTYKYKLMGKGHTLAELNDGKIELTHRDISKEG